MVLILRHVYALQSPSIPSHSMWKMTQTANKNVVTSNSAKCDEVFKVIWDRSAFKRALITLERQKLSFIKIHISEFSKTYGIGMNLTSFTSNSWKILFQKINWKRSELSFEKIQMLNHFWILSFLFVQFDTLDPWRKNPKKSQKFQILETCPGDNLPKTHNYPILANPY